MSTEHTLSGGPRCSFCGVSLEERERMICGPDVRICDRCVRKAAGQIESEGEEEPSNNLPDPTGDDYDRAFQVYARAYDPIKELLRSRYHAGTVRALAVTIAYFRAAEGLEMGSAGDAALQSCLERAWPDGYLNTSIS